MLSLHSADGTGMDVFVARQPIFGREQELCGYELLFRATANDLEFDGRDSALATRELLSNCLLSIGVENLVNGKKAYVNFDRELLLGGLASILPPEILVLEVLESVEPDAEVISACERLRKLGYGIALDDFVSGPRFAALIRSVTIIKVDFQLTSKSEREEILRTYQPSGIKLLAEKVETKEEFEWAWKAGYDLFQGYFFARPTLVRGKQVQMAKVACLRLLSELRQQDLDYASMEKIIREDVSFSYKLLRYVNSALFHFRSDIQAIDHALVVLGEQSVRHWAALAALPVLAKGKPGELITHSLVRARLCELLAENARIQEAPQAFLMGLFSLLDALIDLPLEDALNQMSLSSNIRDVILGRAKEKDKFAMLYQLVRRYEEAEWDQVATLAAGLGIQDPAAVAKAYTKSVRWAHRALHATSSTDEPEHGARRAPYAAHEERESVGP